MSWLDTLSGRPAAPKKPPLPEIPLGVDLAALWEDPAEGGSGLQGILTFVNTGLLGVLLILKILGH